jgi:pyruvate-formate lyase-activating enzyme
MIEDDLLDYVAVDMKHVPEHYAEACGVQINDTFWKNYEELLALLRQEKISYEYRTTVIK